VQVSGALTRLPKYIFSNAKLADARIPHEYLIINFLGLPLSYLEGGGINYI